MREGQADRGGMKGGGTGTREDAENKDKKERREIRAGRKRERGRDLERGDNISATKGRAPCACVQIGKPQEKEK